MREKARVLWWKITSLVQKGASFLHLPSFSSTKYNLKRILAWSGAGVVAIGTVVFAGIMLTSTTPEDSYAAAGPPANFSLYFDYDRLNNVIGYNCDGPNCEHDWNIHPTITGVDSSEINHGLITGATAHCMDGLTLWFPTTGNYMVSLSLVASDQYQGWAEYRGVVENTGAGNQRLLIIVRINWEFTNSQPVTESLASPVVKTGTTVTDSITVFEASETTGQKVTGASSWSKGDSGEFLGVNVAVDAYGPFYYAQDRYPSNSLPDGYFSTTPEAITPPSVVGSNIVVIGDDVTPTAAELRAANSTVFTGAQVHKVDGETLTSATTKISDGTISVDRSYVVVAVGANDLDSGSDVNDYIDKLKGIISAIRSKNRDAKIVLIEALDASGVSATPTMTSINTSPMRDIVRYQAALDQLFADTSFDTSNVGLMKWSRSDTNATSSSTLSCNVSSGTTASCGWNSNLLDDGFLPTYSGKVIYAGNMVTALNNLKPSEGEMYITGAARMGTGADSTTAIGTLIGSDSIFTGYSFAAPGATGWGPYTATFASSDTWRAGRYYFVSHIQKSNNTWVFLDNWYSPFAEDSETTIVQYQPKVMTNVQENFVSSDTVITDSAHVWAEGNSQTSTNPEDQTYWLKNDSGGFSPVEVCIAVYGPYQTAQTPRVNADTTTIADIPDAANKYVTKTCQDMSPSDNDKDFTFTGSTDWTSGYYYFYEYIDKSTQTDAEFIQDSYYADFNPTGSSTGENGEWIYRQFQPFVTSNVSNKNPWIDVKEDNSSGEEIVDRVTARAANSANEANNGYQSAKDDPDAWPKDDDSNYVPVKFHFYLCGPYQYPQDENQANIPPDQKCGAANALKTITRYLTPDKCSTNETPATMSNYTDDGTGVMSCALNFGRTDKDGNYYQPGYYYFTSEMIKSEQTIFVSSSVFPGLTTQTEMSNLISSNWYSKFNPLWKDANTFDEIEWAYVQFQPVVQSYAGATQDADSPNENNWTTRLSYQYKNTVGQYKGLQLNCDEHNEMPTWRNMINDFDTVDEFWDALATSAQTLTCRNVSDRIYIGATTTADVDYSTGIISDVKENEKNWPKTNDNTGGTEIDRTYGAQYETLMYRVKLYGPFSNAATMVNGASSSASNSLSANPSGNDEAGKTVTIVPGSVSSVSGQPVAESCLVAAKYGPNYDDFPEYDTSNPNRSYNAYYSQVEKTSIAQNGYYKATFTQDPANDCLGNGTDAKNTTLILQPGVYVSVVEVWKSDMNENNKFDAGNGDTSDKYFSDNGTQDLGNPGDSQTENSAHKRQQIALGDVRDLMANDFHSKWGDSYETIFVPPDTDIWTERGGSTDNTVDWGVAYYDKYWTAGWSNWCTTFKDIFGNCLVNHSGSADNEFGYTGEDNYFAKDLIDTSNTPGRIKVDLYGPFTLSPSSESQCSIDNHKGTWYVEAKDTGVNGGTTDLENMTLEEGYYVYVMSYSGDDRIPQLQTSCTDPSEIFYIGEPPEPTLETQIDIKSKTGKAPTVVSDTVKVSGAVKEESVVKLSLYRKGGSVRNPKADTQICSVQFEIGEEYIDPTSYSVDDYLDEDGYVLRLHTPDDVAADPNRCFADEAGYYYWHEQFYDPDGEVIKDDHNGEYEGADIEKEHPTVTTMADSSVLVGDPFHDTAYVTIPEGDTKTYKLYMRAYGPTNGAAVCDVVSKTNLLFESGPHEVTKSGSYPSAYTSSVTTGYVYWIETLVDAETNEVVAEGWCGKNLEITRVYDTEPPGSEWQWTTPGTPSAGEVVLSATKIIGLISLLALGAWQLSDKSSWLMRKLNR